MALPPPARQAEAEAINEIYSLAFATLGAKAVRELLDIWQDAPSASPGEIARSSGSVITEMLRLIGVRREHARMIALTYYRLTRALWTGFTIQDVSGQRESAVQLNKLRQDFFHAVESLTPEAMDDRPRNSGDESIKVEEIKGLQKILADLDDHLEEVAATNIQSSGVHFYAKQSRDINLDSPAREVDQHRDKLKRKTGAKVASIGELSVLDSARSAVDAIAENDDRVLGYVRVSRTGTPCYWCAQLISRGLILYKSARSAQLDEEGHEYHTNCHCYAVPVYSEEQFNSDPIFDLNRRYSKLWGSVTKGLGGKRAENAWRRYFRKHPSEVSGAPGARPN